MTYVGPDEIEARYAAVLGTEFGKVYYELVNELVWLHDKWREYRSLYARSDERVELLNQAASRFFGQLDGILWEDVLLHICRLTDRANAGGHKQLSVRRLPPYIADSRLRARVEDLMAEVLKSSEFARDWRNRHIGHRSFVRVVDPTARPLAHASRASVEDALGALDRLLNELHESFFDGGISFDPPGGPGDVDDLVSVLADGVRAHHAREERFRMNQLLPEDYEPPPAV